MKLTMVSYGKNGVITDVFTVAETSAHDVVASIQSVLHAQNFFELPNDKIGGAFIREIWLGEDNVAGSAGEPEHQGTVPEPERADPETGGGDNGPDGPG